MYNEEFKIVGLYDHNADSYISVRNAYESGADVAGIVKATGTGKSYNALQLAYDNKDKKIIYVVPSNSIIEHIKQMIEDNPNLDMERDFPNLEFRTYQSFVNLSEEEIASIPCDLLILDEFHHIGSPVWGARINTMIETHPNMKIFGMTAYTVRDRGTSYERDMANPDTDELFSNKIVSRYDLCDAMIDGVLPKPIYRSAYIKLMDLEEELEKRVQKLNQSSEEYKKLMELLNSAKRRIQEAPSIPELLKKNIKTNGKYIYFCPPLSEDGTNDIETVKKQAIEWFKQFIPEEDIIIYTTTSEMGKEGKLNRNAFYNDTTLDGELVDNKLRVMFAINQYNEGVHAPNLDGVILGRGTSSDIVYFEQLGRALAVRGNTKEVFEKLEEYSIEELTLMCKSRDIPVKEKIAKEELIEKLIAPVIIDLTNNIEFIKELENNLKDRIREIQTKGLGNHREIKIKDVSFDIEIENQDLFEILQYVKERLSYSWEEMYEYAKKYYENHGNLEVPTRFKTNDGYTIDKNGVINLGQWIQNQRKRISPESDQGKLLTKIGMRFKNKNIPWKEMYEYAKLYFEEYKNLEVPQAFRTNDGYTRDENGVINLGQWIADQRQNTDPESDKGKLLIKIGMRFETKKNIPWEEMYEYAKKYYEHYENLEVPTRFKTNDGYTIDENGVIPLGSWISRQRKITSPESDQGKLLEQIGMRFEKKYFTWEEMYEYAKIYYKNYGTLEIPQKFKTNDGFTRDENGVITLGKWISHQRHNTSPESNRGKLLEQIGMRFETKKYIAWEEMYEYAKKYYEHYGNLKVLAKFKTNDGFTRDENGVIHLGEWIWKQRKNTSPESDRGILLTKIGMIWNVKSNKEEVNQIFLNNNIDITKNNAILSHISIQELQSKIEFLKSHNIPIIDGNGLLIDIFSMSNLDMQEKYHISLEELIDKYYLKNKGKGV